MTTPVEPFDLAQNGLITVTMTDPIPLDLKGLKCPLPALRLRRALAKANPGTRLYVTVTDPMAVIDIPHALNETGDRLIEETRIDTVIAFLIEKA